MNNVIVSATAQGLNHTCIHFSQTPLPSRPPHKMEQSSLCCTAGPPWLSTLNIAVPAGNGNSKIRGLQLVALKIQSTGPWVHQVSTVSPVPKLLLSRSLIFFFARYITFHCLIPHAFHPLYRPWALSLFLATSLFLAENILISLAHACRKKLLDQSYEFSMWDDDDREKLFSKHLHWFAFPLHLTSFLTLTCQIFLNILPSRWGVNTISFWSWCALTINCCIVYSLHVFFNHVCPSFEISVYFDHFSIGLLSYTYQFLKFFICLIILSWVVVCISPSWWCIFPAFNFSFTVSAREQNSWF